MKRRAVTGVSDESGQVMGDEARGRRTQHRAPGMAISADTGRPTYFREARGRRPTHSVRQSRHCWPRAQRQ